jgi:hypothetical protein
LGHSSSIHHQGATVEKINEIPKDDGTSDGYGHGAAVTKNARGLAIKRQEKLDGFVG